MKRHKIKLTGKAWFAKQCGSQAHPDQIHSPNYKPIIACNLTTQWYHIIIWNTHTNKLYFNDLRTSRQQLVRIKGRARHLKPITKELLKRLFNKKDISDHKSIGLMGRKGISTLGTGFIYAPYIPVLSTPGFFTPDDFLKGVKKRIIQNYARKILNPKWTVY